ncbi:fibroleukin-like [Saccostrea echinata]|uniref:fibroleukin-like n=1 Tax=Saccostrea echinata TaxID=191078 RepID=UPI002A815298|nr:fibroleukin-like [Saccostrea echinata]
MGSLWAIYLIFVFFAVSHSTIISRKYITKLEFDDKKSSDELLKEYNSTSSIECATLCQRECSFYGFNSQMKKCRTHKKIFTSEMSNEAGWRYYSHDFPASVTPIDCKDLHADGHTKSGVYNIYPYGTITSPVRVYCDMETMDGGWTAIQKRVNGSLSFDRNWTEYKNGFGSPEQDIWVGNDLIHQLTKENNSFLYVSITLQNSTTLYEMYDRFLIFNEAENYKLILAGPATGTLGDSMLDTGNPNKDLSGMYFTTQDRDNDRNTSNCAKTQGGGWWFKRCHHAFLNGPWYPVYWHRPWHPTLRNGTSVRGTMMLIKRH